MSARRTIGLVGTGYWAEQTHARAVAESERWTLAAVWGRDPAAVARIARAHDGARDYEDFDAFLDAVDAVTFAVPPDVQAPLAVRAMVAGKHVCLEKPISTNPATADALVAAADESGVATAVFFTMLYDPRVRAIIGAAEGGQRWSGGAGLWLGSALGDENPFNTPWRHVKGGLWDVGPHAVAVLWRTLGPVVGVLAAARGERDLVHVTLEHERGGTSTMTLTLSAPDAADGFSTLLWGPDGRLEVPVDDVDPVASLKTALHGLADSIDGVARPDVPDVRFGRDVVRVLASAERLLADDGGR